MQGRIYIRETGPDQVTMDMTASPSELAYKERAQGFAFQKTLEHLGLDASDPAKHLGLGALQIEGTVNGVRDNIGQLQKHIGVIARYSGQKADSWHKYQEDFVGRTLGKLVQKDLPNLPENATLMRVIGMVADPFAQETNDDGVQIYYARQPHWTAEGKNARALNTDGTPIKPFHVRDIGGLLIDASGQATRKQYSTHIVLPGAARKLLDAMGEVKGRSPAFAEEFRDAFSAYMDLGPDQRQITLSNGADIDETWEKLKIRLPREALAQFYDENEGNPEIEDAWLNATLAAANDRADTMFSDELLLNLVADELKRRKERQDELARLVPPPHQ